jgi:hypothetical protein
VLVFGRSSPLGTGTQLGALGARLPHSAVAPAVLSCYYYRHPVLVAGLLLPQAVSPNHGHTAPATMSLLSPLQGKPPLFSVVSAIV